MNQYLAGTAVTLKVDEFVDEDGNILALQSAVYRLVDQDGNVLIEDTELDLQLPTLVIAAEYNTLPTIDLDAITSETIDAVTVNQARTVELDLVLEDGNTIGQEISYIIYPRERLITGLNSFQTLAQANLTAGSIYDVEEFTKNATTAQKVAALIEARDRIARLPFVDITLGQSYLGHGTPVDLNRLTPREFGALTERFKAALKKAQVAEANDILGGGDVIEQMRRQGLASQTIGETHETYRPGMPPTSSVCKAALMYLGEFLSSSKKIART